MDTFHLYQDIQARAHVPQLLLGGKFGIRIYMKGRSARST